jgi:hypothetical protein
MTHIAWHGRGGGSGGWSCTSAATRGQRALLLLRFFNPSGLVKREVPCVTYDVCPRPALWLGLVMCNVVTPYCCVDPVGSRIIAISCTSSTHIAYASHSCVNPVGSRIIAIR